VRFDKNTENIGSDSRAVRTLKLVSRKLGVYGEPLQDLVRAKVQES
jgi:hypothetical protein